MNFFEAQDSARTRSRTLVVLFVAAVAAIIVAIYAVVHMVLGPGVQGGINPGLLLAVAVFTSGLIAAGSMARTVQLRQGGSKVAELMGGRRVKPNTTDDAERRLVNVVEEMAIASGTPVPAIYVMDNEPGINAFAAGYTLDDAAVAVTKGTLDRLSRDELQGVIAHEFSHILNGDMRLNIRLMGILFGILLLAIVGRGLLRSGAFAGRGRRGGRDSGGGQIALVGIALIAVGYIGVFFGKLIQAAVSRQREFLADSSAVQFTRNPDGIAGALKKIGGLSSRIEDHHAQEAGHLFFANGLGKPFAGMLATHPPLTDRIQRLDPSFAGEYPQQQAARRAAGDAAPRRAASMAGFASDEEMANIDAPAATASPARATDTVPAHAPAGPARAAAGTLEVSGAALLASIGAPQPEHVAYAGRLLASLPQDVRDAAHEPDRAAALLFALLLHDDGDAVARQRDVVVAAAGEAVLKEATALADALRPLGLPARLPVLDVLLPALRELTPDQQAAIRSAAGELVAADQRMDMFEFALLHVLNRQLTTVAQPRRAPEPEPVKSLGALRGDVEVILSAAAWSGTDDLAEARSAFATGADSLHRQAGPMDLRRRSAIDLGAVDAALARARAALPTLRRRIIEACSLVAAHDGRIHMQEAEMLRAVAEAIDCPMPPVGVL
jgi:Zn-dependent protease with chaperone function